MGLLTDSMYRFEAPLCTRMNVHQVNSGRWCCLNCVSGLTDVRSNHVPQHGDGRGVVRSKRCDGTRVLAVTDHCHAVPLDAQSSAARGRTLTVAQRSLQGASRDAPLTQAPGGMRRTPQRDDRGGVRDDACRVVGRGVPAPTRLAPCWRPATARRQAPRQHGVKRQIVDGMYDPIGAIGSLDIHPLVFGRTRRWITESKSSDQRFNIGTYRIDRVEIQTPINSRRFHGDRTSSWKHRQ